MYLHLNHLWRFAIKGCHRWFTVPGLLPDPYFRLWIKNMHKAKHGSDSESYDKKGVFDESRFEDMFR
jgi:peroxygenase